MQQKTIRTVLITGANKGLGYGMVESLCKSNPLNLNIILGARDIKRGQEAVSKLKQQYPNSNVKFSQIDIGNQESHQKLIKELQNQQQKIDILVNNAAILLGTKNQDNTIQETQETFRINYYGTVQFTKDILPQLSNDARIINFGSGLGSLNIQGKYIQEQLSNPNVSEEKIDELLQSHLKQLQGLKTNTDWAVKGYSPAYSASKAALQTFFRFVINKHITEQQSVYNLCPGWCQTSMGGQEAERTIDQGINFALQLINYPNFGRDTQRHAQFFRDGQQIQY